MKASTSPSRFKGIAIFGAPGSGKTVIGQHVKKLHEEFSLLEASLAAVQPLSGQTVFPERIEDLLPLLEKPAPARTDSRAQLREVHDALTQTYGANAVGQILHLLCEKNASPTLILGARGLENATYLQGKGYAVFFLSDRKKLLNERVARRDSVTLEQAEKDFVEEETQYHTSNISSVAEFSFTTENFSPQFTAERMLELYFSKECKICMNTSINPVTPIGDDGLCPPCRQYQHNYSRKTVQDELSFLLTQRNKVKEHDVMVGISGGKDSTVTLYLLKELGFSPFAFTFDIGYYPEHIFTRSAKVAKDLQVDHEVISIQGYVTDSMHSCYQQTVDLYDEKDSDELAQKFRNYYIENRAHYSAKDTTVLPFVRSCQLCRKAVIPAYYGEAKKRGISIVVLGINEWTGLSQHSDIGSNIFSGIRKLQPFSNESPVYVVHLPFLLHVTRDDVAEIAKEIGWDAPIGEDLIESNSNSCLFARAAEARSTQLLGFHPDVTRLSREVTAGFMSKAEGKMALRKNHAYNLSVREVIEKAKLL